MAVERQLPSPRQQDCLRAIYGYLVREGQYPSQREICEMLGVKSTAAAIYLGPLELKGYIVRTPKARRNIQLTKRGVALVRSDLLVTSSVNGGSDQRRD